MTDYSKMTNADFDRILIEVIEDAIHEYGWHHLLSIGDIYSTLVEEFHNAVLDKWEISQPLAEEEDDAEERPEGEEDATRNRL